jgi:phage shock protein A
VGVLGQIAVTLKSGLRAALAPAADPRTTYVSAHQKQQALLAQVALAVDQVTASKLRLRERARADHARLPAMLDEARSALLAGRADDARLWLRRRQVLTVELTALESQLGEVEKEEANLRALQHRLVSEVDAFAARQEAIVARYNAAEAQIQIKEAVTGVSDEFAELTSALLLAEERTEGMEARVSAIDRLVREGLLDSSVLPSVDRDQDLDVEGQLAMLKSEILER